MKNPKLFLALVFLVVLSSCNPPPDTTIRLFIPINCKLTPLQKISISLTGDNIPGDVEVEWKADRGTIVPKDGMMAEFIAPDTAGLVVISAQIKIGDTFTNPEPVTCMVEEPATIATQVLISPPTPQIISGVYTIAITEIMGNPCGRSDEEYVNEYIELYNYGELPVDLSGLLITTTQQHGDVDELVSWEYRNPGDKFGDHLILNSMVLQPRKFAIVLSPVYRMANVEFKTPYTFPPETMIITMKDGDRIGQKDTNIFAVNEPLDSILLFNGSRNQIIEYVSSYGLQRDALNLQDLSNSRQTKLPLIVKPDCSAVQKKLPGGEDIFDNWELITKGNPGSGQY